MQTPQTTTLTEHNGKVVNYIFLLYFFCLKLITKEPQQHCLGDVQGAGGGATQGSSSVHLHAVYF